MIVRLAGFIKRKILRQRLDNLGCFSYAFGVKKDQTNYRIGKGSLNRASVTFEKNDASLTIGDNSSMGGGTILSIADKIEIGSNVLISFNCIFTDNNGHSLNLDYRKKDLSNYLNGNEKEWTDIKFSGISIGDGCWIGANSMILKGVKLGSNVIVGAGSVVTKSVPDNTVVVGNPAEIVKSND